MIEAGSPHYWPHLFDPLSSNAKLFVGSLMEKDQTRRLSAKAALQHPWLSPQAQRVADPRADGHLLRGFRTFADASPVRRACLSMVAWSLTSQDADHVCQLFLSMAGPRGTVSMRCLASALAVDGQISAAEAARVLEALCIDESSEISYREFVAAFLAGDRAIGDSAPTALRTAFNRFDADRSEGVGNQCETSGWVPTCFEDFIACCKGVDEAVLEIPSVQCDKHGQTSAISTCDTLCAVDSISSCCSDGSISDAEC